MKKLQSKKGFTLMEMLIVVAIIAILVAIAIPTFGSSLAGARKGADDANIRAAYAQFQIDSMLKADYDAETATGVATASAAAAAFAAIEVDELQYYTGVSIPPDGSRWLGTGTGGGIADIADTHFTAGT